MVVPYLAGGDWYSEYLSLRLQGEPEDRAAAEATKLTVASKRDLYRTKILGANGPMMISVPVEGGAASVKRLPYQAQIISGHGDWPRIHTGALEAAYGRAPYYAHFAPKIIETLREPGRSMADFCQRLHRLICGFAGIDDIGALRGQLADSAEIVETRSLETAGLTRPEFTILDLIFREGREAIFPLLNCYFNKDKENISF